MRLFTYLPVLLLAGAFSATASVDSGLLSLVPAGSKLIAGIDVTRARNSEFGQYLLSKAQTEDAHFQEMIEQTGFDPRRDLQSLVFATDGGAGKKASFAILARGNFDPARIKSLAATKGAGLAAYGGVDMIVPNEGARETAVAFLEVGVAAMADTATLKQMIDNRATPSALDGDLKSRIGATGKSNDVWFVSSLGGAFLADHAAAAGANAGAPMKAMQGVVQSSGGVKLGATVDSTFDAVTRSAQDAASLSDVIRFMASMVQMQRQKDPRAAVVAAALDKMTLENSGAAVHFAVSMPEKSLEQLADAGARARDK